MSQGDKTFTALRKITALKNVAFDITKSDLATKVSGGSASASDLAAAASSVKAQLKDKGGDTCSNLDTLLANSDGPCTISDATPCCGKGICVAGSTTKYMCKCNNGYGGLAC